MEEEEVFVPPLGLHACTFGLDHERESLSNVKKCIKKVIYEVKISSKIWEENSLIKRDWKSEKS